MNYLKNEKNKGITLISLVVTIIVLLILAGISITMLTGDNGILKQAVNAKEKSDIAQTIEQARLDIMSKLAEKLGKNLTEEEVKTILGRYFLGVPANFNDLSITVTTKDRGYTVPLAEVLNGINIDLSELNNMIGEEKDGALNFTGNKIQNNTIVISGNRMFTVNPKRLNSGDKLIQNAIDGDRKYTLYAYRFMDETTIEGYENHEIENDEWVLNNGKYEYTIPTDGIYRFLCRFRSSTTYVFQSEDFTEANDNIYIDFLISSTGAITEVNDVKNVARLGYGVYQRNTPPEQSIESYKLAYLNNYRVFLADLQITSDGIPVCWHDTNLADGQARNHDGSAITGEHNIAEYTLAQLNDSFDFGGSYKGQTAQNIMTLDEFLKLSKYLNVEVMLETKVKFTDSQLEIIGGIINKYEMGDKFFFCEGTGNIADTLAKMVEIVPKTKVVIRRANQSSASYIMNYVTRALDICENVYLMVTDTYVITDTDIINKCNALGVGLAYSEIKTDEDMQTFYNNGYLNYFEYVSSRIDIYTWLRNKLFS